MRAIRGGSGTARVSRETHELGRPSSLELTTPACMSRNGSLLHTGGDEGVGCARSSEDGKDSTTLPE
jgi:hypothetical protein